VGAYLQNRLRDTFKSHAIVGDVRGTGMLAALEFMRDREARIPFDASDKVGPRVAAALLERGVIARAMPHGDILCFARPLVTRRDDVDLIIKATREAVDDVADAIVS
jgi:L-2,4-diaminobutyrate transaminase